MKITVRCAAICLLGIAGCSGADPGATTQANAPTAAPAVAEANMQVIMLTQVNPQGLALWDIANNAMNDAGAVDAGKISAAQWQQLTQIGTALEAAGRALATSQRVIAAPPGAKLQDEVTGGSSAAQVQGFLDANPALLRTHALKLQETGKSAIEAASAHDAAKLSAVSDGLDAVCEGCHVDFWYPQQKQPK